MKKYKKEVAEEIIKRLSNDKIKAIVKQIKSEGEGRSFKVIATTDAVDRYDEVIEAEAWDFKNFLKNPVILWGHKSTELPIGIATKVYQEGTKTIVEGIFASKEANPLAEQVKLLYDEKMIKTVSVGFMGNSYKIEQKDNKEILIWTDVELLELSFVSVPANPEALSVLKAKGLKNEIVEEKTIEKRVEILESKVDKHEKEFTKVHARVKRKFDEVLNHIKASKNSDEKEKAESLDEETMSYLKNKKELLQDLNKFTSEALHTLKKV